MQDDLPSLLEFNPSIPQSVENIIIKATAKNLNDRYHNATEMLDDLNTCLDRLNEEKLVFLMIMNLNQQLYLILVKYLVVKIQEILHQRKQLKMTMLRKIKVLKS